MVSGTGCRRNVMSPSPSSNSAAIKRCGPGVESRSRASFGSSGDQALAGVSVASDCVEACSMKQMLCGSPDDPEGTGPMFVQVTVLSVVFWPLTAFQVGAEPPVVPFTLTC